MDKALLTMLGVIVVEVPGLDVEACYVEDRRVALIRPDLPEPVRRRAFDWLLAQTDRLGPETAI